MAGLTTAWELSRGDWRERLNSITVYQRGWRLGGKGASSRGPFDRIEEHGLHVLLGYYDATFRVLREVYDELDRPRRDPACPIRTWRDAVAESRDVGLADDLGDSWGHYVTRFSTNDAEPGEPGAEDRPLEPLTVVARALRLLLDFQRSLAGQRAGRVRLSGSPAPDPLAGDAASWVRGAGLVALAAALEMLERTTSAVDGVTNDLLDPLVDVLAAWRDGLRASVLSDPQARRTWQLVDLAATNVLGMVTDGLLTPSAYATIDHLDYREWLAKHGAARETLDSAIVRGMYDLVFAYEDGDKSRPRFAAGLGLELAGRMLFDFKGSIFWRMQAGMGEVVFAPLYEALSRRGVEFRFFHRLDHLSVGEGRALDRIHLTRQVDLADGRDTYDPLITVQGLPCWPHDPLSDQLAGEVGADLESHSDGSPGVAAVTLLAGVDYDVAVLAVSLGMLPHVASELIEKDPAWRAMVDNVATVGTRSAQLWLNASESDLGWDGPPGVTLSAFGDTFDTWADMTHLLPREGWPPGTAPRSLAYLCSAMPDTEPDSAEGVVRAGLQDYLDHQVAALWPGSVDEHGFRWDLLVDDEERVGPDRLLGQYVRANLDPSDRYVQSLPGSGRYRIAPAATGFANLAVAGDWTACGLDAGCVEAATRSGVLAARGVLEGWT